MFVVLGLLVGVVLLLSGYLLLTYLRPVGIPPSAEPVPEQCQVSAELLARVGTPSWQRGSLHSSDEMQGVSCRWAAAEDENVRQRRLRVTVYRHAPAGAAEKYLTERADDFGDRTVDQDAVGDEAITWSSDGIASLIARRGQIVVDIEVTGSDKSFFSGVLGDSVETEVPATELRELAIAVAQELIALDR